MEDALFLRDDSWTLSFTTAIKKEVSVDQTPFKMTSEYSGEEPDKRL